jgi:hypothetical protein
MTDTSAQDRADRASVSSADRGRRLDGPTGLGSRTNDTADTLSTQFVPDAMPDLRRDAIEEAAETSPEARMRIDELNAREAAMDASLSRRV